MSICKYLNVRLRYSVTSEDHLSLQHQGCSVLLTVNKSPDWNHIQPDRIWEERWNTTCLLYCGGCREEMNLLYVLKIRSIVFRHWSFGGPHFLSLSCGTWEAIWSTLRTTEWVNTRKLVRNLYINLFVVYVMTSVNAVEHGMIFWYWIMRLDWTEIERKRLWPILRYSFDISLALPRKITNILSGNVPAWIRTSHSRSIALKTAVASWPEYC